MPAVASYTEATLATWMAAELGDIGVLLGWTAGHLQIAHAVTEAERLLGVSDVAAVVDAGAYAAGHRAELAGAVAVWRRVVRSLGAKVDTRMGDLDSKRSQRHAVAMQALTAAEYAALPILSTTPAVRVDALHYVHDPYAYVDPAHAVFP